MLTSTRSVFLVSVLVTAVGCEGAIGDPAPNAPTTVGRHVTSTGMGGAASGAGGAASGAGGAVVTAGGAGGAVVTVSGAGGAASGAGGAARGTGGAASGAGGATRGTGGAASGTGGAASGAGGAVVTVGGSGGATGAGGAASTQVKVWQPIPKTTWQWQLTGSIDVSVEAEMFDIDLFDVAATTVSALHARGRKVICYVSAGSYEDWRPDAAQFPAAVKGKALDGWPGEAWLDIRRIDLLAPVIEARLDLCRSKGFDGIEFDNVDGYSNASGFPLTAADQLRYNRYLADAAHARGLSVGLKNDLDQVGDLVSSFDWAINEECFAFGECDLLRPFITAGKAVFNTEYEMTAAEVCPQAKAMGLSTLIKNLNLDAARQACP